MSKQTKIEFIEGELGSCQFFVNTKIDSIPIKLQIDTGSTYTSVPNLGDFEKYSAISVINRQSASGVSVSAEKIKVEEFEFAGIIHSNVEIVKYNKDTNPTGRIGMDLLKHYFTTFDFVNKKLLLDNPCSTNLDQKSYELILHEKNHFSIAVEFCGHDQLALWDTGAELSVIDENLVLKNPKDFEFIQDIDNGLDATGNSVQFKLYKAKNLKIGEYHLHENVMSMNFDMIHNTIDTKISMILGANLMRNHVWYFNFTQGRWFVSH